MLDRENNAVYNPSYFHSISGGKKLKRKTKQRRTKNIFRKNKKKLRTRTSKKKQFFSRRNK